MNRSDNSSVSFNDTVPTNQRDFLQLSNSVATTAFLFPCKEVSAARLPAFARLRKIERGKLTRARFSAFPIYLLFCLPLIVFRVRPIINEGNAHDRARAAARARLSSDMEQQEEGELILRCLPGRKSRETRSDFFLSN